MKQEKEYPLDNPAKSSPQTRVKSPERILKEKQEKKTKRSKRRGVEVVILHAIASLAFLGMLFTVDVFPLKHTAVVVGVVFVLFLITYLTQKKRKLHILGKIWGILVSIILAIGVLVLVVFNMAFDSVVGGEEKENNVVVSVTGEVFHVLIDEGGEYRLATVNPEKHQILMTNIPADYFVAIPGVSDGKRDTLKNAENYGVEAVMAAVGSLFETEVQLYAKINLADLQETLETFTPDAEVSLADITGTIGDNIETNLSKRQVQQLVKLYLREDATWEILSNSAEGRNSSNYTYTEPEKVSFVIEPDKDSVAKTIELINRVEDGEKLTTLDVAE